MKIVFLDIDGVLNNETCDYVDLAVGRFGRKQEYIDFDCIARLNKITDETGAVIVVSSTWRFGLSVDELITLFHALGITGKVIGKTDQKENNYTFRGNEIFKWINDNISATGHKYRWEFTDYVIIDDDSDMLLWQFNNFVHTDGRIGLTDVDAEKAISILNGTYEKVKY